MKRQQSILIRPVRQQVERAGQERAATEAVPCCRMCVLPPSDCWISSLVIGTEGSTCWNSNYVSAAQSVSMRMGGAIVDISHSASVCVRCPIFQKSHVQLDSHNWLEEQSH